MMKLGPFVKMGWLLVLALVFACNPGSGGQEEETSSSTQSVTAAEILGNPDYQAISFGGYRDTTREIQPTIAQLKEDMQILHAMGIRVLRTYHTKRPHALNVLKAIRELKTENPGFEMYVMVGIWIDCKDAWTDNPDHEGEDAEENAAELQRAVAWANEYPDIVKILAVGNEAMVKWAAGYFVQADVILKYVNQLQEMKQNGGLPANLWITCSDNFASWGGGGEEYHTEDLNALIRAVDYVSVHTYPMHDTHYNPDFWGTLPGEMTLSDSARISRAMLRARDYAMMQYENTVAYVHGIDPDKPVHIGETGWASYAKELYGDEGSKACDEYKMALYHDLVREWTDAQGISCFYFEAFDEPWKGGDHPGDSEKHFGLFKVDGKAKYAIWELVDQGIFEGLSRGGNPIEKTYGGDLNALLQEVKLPPVNDAALVKP